MKLEQLLEGVPFTLVQGSTDTEISDIIYDSRKAAPGLAFVCIVGTQRDSHEFAADCAAKGVSALVIQHDIDLAAVPGVTVVKVESSRYAMALMSGNLFGNPSRKMTMIGVTGTKGKTTTTHMIKSVLEAAGRKVGMIGTNGIYYMGKHKDTANTTPESYELQKTFREFLDAGCDTALMEVSSQGLMMDRVAGIHYDVGVFTNLSPDHIGGSEHPDYAHYRACKKSLFTDYPVGLALCNADDPEAAFMMDGVSAPVRYFSVLREQMAPDGSLPVWRATDIRPSRSDGKPGMTFHIASPDGLPACFLPMPGVFNVSNALGAVALCREGFGIRVPQAAEALADAAVPGRFEIITHPAQPSVTYIIDYAHNGLSLAAILDTLRAYRPARLICLFGSVGERTVGRRAELAQAAAGRADFCILTSDNPGREPPEDVIRDIDNAFPAGACPRLCLPDRADAIRQAVAMARPGDMILLAGKGHESYQLIGTSRIPFREKDILISALDAYSPADLPIP